MNSYLKLIDVFFIANCNKKWKGNFQKWVTKITRIEEKTIQQNSATKLKYFQINKILWIKKIYNFKTLTVINGLIGGSLNGY